eukprot:TRINITY_DN1666_c0_g2_i1.p1 TRINITY_DN1666_c0_g2~~TRINITY_DN1666_c0_g2_i1.p1  ORF type:complete len:765 (+),score=128.87 TRINITY_DN1666_c0_g2_i1:36-2297(+)
MATQTPSPKGDDTPDGEQQQPGLMSHLPYGDTIASWITGGLTGFLGSMAGVGGGPFCVPLLAWLFKINHFKCSGTSLVCGVTTLCVGGVTTFYNSGKSVEIAVGPIIILSLVASGMAWFSAKHSDKLGEVQLKKIFAWFLLFCALQILYKLAYTPTGIEGHWSYHLSDDRDTPLVYEIERTEGELMFRTGHLGGVLKEVAEAKGELPIQEGFADGWYSPLTSTAPAASRATRGVMFVSVLNRGETMKTIYYSKVPHEHWNEPIIATRKESDTLVRLRSFAKTEAGAFTIHSVIGVIAGTASGLLGIAGGSVVVPLMSLSGLYSFQSITTTSLLSMIPASSTSLLTHYRKGNVVMSLAPGLVFGTILGAFMGSFLMAITTETVRKATCAGVLLFSASIMISGSFQVSSLISDKGALLRLGSASIFFFCIAALLQEKVFNLPEFNHEHLLTFMQSIVTIILALLDMKRSSINSTVSSIVSGRKCPLAVYVLLAVLMAVGSLCTNRASKLLDYTTQVVFKSSKLPWIMLWRVVFLSWKRKPSLMEWIYANLLSAGLAIFVIGGTFNFQTDTVTSDKWSGLFSIYIALCCDATLYTIQEGVVFAAYGADKHELILFMSGLTVPASFLLLLHSGSFSTSWLYLQMEWRFPTLICAYAACNYMGMKFLLQIVQEFDANMAVLTTSLRKAATIVLSYALFPKAVSGWHVVGIVMIAVGTYGHIQASEGHRHKHRSESPAQTLRDCRTDDEFSELRGITAN